MKNAWNIILWLAYVLANLVLWIQSFDQSRDINQRHLVILLLAFEENYSRFQTSLVLIHKLSMFWSYNSVLALFAFKTIKSFKKKRQHVYLTKFMHPSRIINYACPAQSAKRKLEKNLRRTNIQYLWFSGYKRKTSIGAAFANCQWFTATK